MKLFLSARSRPGQASPELPVSRRELSVLVAHILSALGLSGSSLSLTLLDDHGVALLNRQYLGCEGPTNILSFPSENAADSSDLGELFLSTETFERECFLYGQPPTEHLARLLAHGILHLAGHEHGPQMEELTDMAVRFAVKPSSA